MLVKIRSTGNAAIVNTNHSWLVVVLVENSFVLSGTGISFEDRGEAK